MEKNEKDDRRKFIGGSDAAAIMGLSRYKGAYQLWLEKTGREEQEDISEKESVRFGVLLEGTVAQEWARRHNAKVRRVNERIVHHDFPFIRAQIDRRIVGGGILECKTASLRFADEWTDTMPVHYWVQVQHQLMVTGIDEAWVACLVGGQELKEYHVPRNEEFISAMIEKELEFWDCVTEDTPPEATTVAEARQAWPNSQQLPVYGGDEEFQMVVKLCNLENDIARLEDEAEKIKAKLASIIKDAGDTLVINNVPVVTFKTYSTERLDTKMMKEKHPELQPIFEECTVKSESRRFMPLATAYKVAGIAKYKKLLAD